MGPPGPVTGFPLPFTYRLLYNLNFIVLYCLHKCNDLRVVIFSLFFLHVVISFIVVTNRNTRWHWLLKIISCEWGHQAAVPPSGSDFQKQMCLVVRKKNCVCGDVVKITAVGDNLYSV